MSAWAWTGIVDAEGKACENEVGMSMDGHERG
jgi:hypothetical protein